MNVLKLVSMIFKEKYIRFFIIVLLVAWLGVSFLRQINLSTADLGRHIKNGELILQGNLDVLKTNFYSYTHSDFLFINHHWGGGVLFYLAYKASGFVGTHILFILFSLATFILAFLLAEKKSNYKIASIVSIFIIPLIAYRSEVRPEVFSTFFAILFYWILYGWKKGEIKTKYLYLLPVITLFWANIHIYFMIGLGVIGAFWLELIISSFQSKDRASELQNAFLDRPYRSPDTKSGRERSIFFRLKIWPRVFGDRYFAMSEIKILSYALLSSIFVSLINPAGIKGLLYPLNIFKEYGYQVVENQSVWFLHNYGMRDLRLYLFVAVFVAIIVGLAVSFAKSKKSTKRISEIFDNADFFIIVSLGILSLFIVRNIALFAFFALPIFSGVLDKILPKDIEDLSFYVFRFAVFVLIFFSFLRYAPLYNNGFGVGLLPGINGAADFVKENNIKGPIFNNYDIGSYLDFHLYSEEKVFVDNRPEAYPVPFFKDVYIPAQQNDDVWKEVQEKYKLNSIIFYRRDMTPWAQKFLIARAKDDEWIPVFVDNYNIVFLKQNEQNKIVIDKYEMPKSAFGY